MKTHMILALVASFGVAAPALADPGTARPAKVERPATKSPNQMICERGRMTGSMIVRTTCKTRAEWLAEGAKLPKHV
jgi:hypothetical protein